LQEEYRYDLFVSYIEADQAWVEGFLLDAFKNAGIKYISESEFTPGNPRIDELERAIRQSRYTLLIISEAYLSGEVTQFTNTLAQSYGDQLGTWPVIPMIMHKGLQLPPRLKMLQGLEVGSAVEHLCELLKRSIPSLPPKPSCPYPGMVTFTEDDELRFFGRDKEIEEAEQSLRIYPFLAMIGPSGSGKSSLIFAGLIPKLKKSGLFGNGQWYICSLRPGASPLANLHKVLGGDLAVPETRIKQLLSAQTDTKRLFLVVDQFEEVFAEGSEEAIPFQQALLKMIGVSNVYVILSVRADFYPDLMRSLLWEKIRSHRFEVVPLDEKELRKAIIRPAESVDVYIDSALVERLVIDARGEPGVLPLIQETLVLLWGKLQRRFLPLKAYELLIIPLSAYESVVTQPLTGLQVAIARRADAAFTDLEYEEKQIIARRIFLRLIQFGEGRADVRRQQVVSDLCSIGKSSVLSEQTLKHLVDRRLLTLSGQEQGEPKVDIAHEALISGWPRLKQWIRERRESEIIQRKLEAKVEEWKQLGSGESGLLDEVQISKFQEWLKTVDAKELGEGNILNIFVEKSQNRIQAAKAKEKEDQERELSLINEALKKEKLATDIEKRLRKNTQQWNKKQKIGLVFLGLSLILVLVFAAITHVQKVNAELQAMNESTLNSLTEKQDFDALQEGLKSAKYFKDSWNWGIDNTTKYQLVSTLQQVVYGVGFIEKGEEVFREQNRLEKHRFAVNSIDSSQDLIATGSEGEENPVIIWRKNGQFLKRLPVSCSGKHGFSKISSVNFSPNGLKLIATQEFISDEDTDSKNGGVSQNRVKCNLAIWRYDTDSSSFKSLPPIVHPASITSASWSRNGWIASGDANGYIFLWNESGLFQKKWKAHDGRVTGISINKDNIIVTTGSDKTIKLWDLAGMPLKIAYPEKQAAVVKLVKFNSDGKYFMTITSAQETNFSNISLWKLGEQKPQWIKNSSSVLSGDFSLDGQKVASGSENGNIIVWNLKGKQLDKFTGNKSKVYGLKYMSNKIILSAGEDNTVRLWQGNTILPKRSTIPVEAIEDLYAISFSAKTIARFHKNSSSDCYVKVWAWDNNHKSDKTIPLSECNVNYLKFSSSAKFIAIANDRGIALFDITKDIPILQDNWQAPTIPAEDDFLKLLEFSQNSKTLISVSNENVVNVWSLSEQNNYLKQTSPPLSIPITAKQVNVVRFSANGDRIAIASNDGTIKLFNIENGKPVEDLVDIELSNRAHAGSVWDLCFSPDGKYIATVSEDTKIKLWTSSGKLIRTFQNRNLYISHLRFSPDSQILISSSASLPIIGIWSLEGKIIGILKGSLYPINDIDYILDSNKALIISYGKDNASIRLIEWNLDLDSLTKLGSGWISNYLLNHPNSGN
jgi:WD40 repeat protein